MQKIWILIPAYKPDEKLLLLTQKLIADFPVLVVDDGGGEAYGALFEKVQAMGALVLHHQVNRGKGAALKTGIAHLLQREDCLGAVTADADGQHTPEDIARIAEAMQQEPDAMIIGGRDFSQMPPRSKTGNTITRFFFRLCTGLAISDTQTGLRGLPYALFDKLLQVSGDRYEYEMNMLLALKLWKTPYREISIQTVYLDNNSSSHFNALRDGMRVFSRLFRFVFTRKV